jgi:hypothetical protein
MGLPWQPFRLPKLTRWRYSLDLIGGPDRDRTGDLFHAMEM